MVEAEDVKQAAAGRWLDILSALAPALAPAIERVGRHVGCPVHGGKDGFRLFKDAPYTGGCVCNSCGAHQDGLATLQWINQWDFQQALMAVADYLGFQGQNPPPLPPPTQRIQPAPEPDLAQRAKQLRNIWSATIPLSDPQAAPVQAYLQGRGYLDRLIPMMEATRTVRFHPRLAYFNDDEELVGHFPAMVAMIVDASGKPASLHRTYLTPEGLKAPVECPKKMMTPLRRTAGGAIPLGKRRRVMGVTEGIETALAVTRATGMTCWAAVNATLLERFQVPPGVEELVIWGDHDRSERGVIAAKTLKTQVWKQGYRCGIYIPPYAIPSKEKSLDWNDVLLAQGVHGFPCLRRRTAA